MSEPTSDLHRDFGRMEGKLDAVLSEFRAIQRTHSARMDAYDVRLKKLEDTELERHGALKAARWFGGFLAGAIGLLSGLLGAWLGVGR